MIVVKLKVEINADDIARGDRENPREDALARALRRAFGGKQFETGVRRVFRLDIDDADGFLLPEEVQRWMRLYMNGKLVDPISFDLTVNW